ncbi:MAG TPA: hypothetical protein V6D50_25410 [Chroococcales cyanobacterium]
MLHSLSWSNRRSRSIEPMVSDRKWLDASLYHVRLITLNKSLFVASASAPL